MFKIRLATPFEISTLSAEDLGNISHVGSMNPQRHEWFGPCKLPWVMALSAMGLKLGIFCFFPTTHAKTMRLWFLHAMRVFTDVYLHPHTAVDAGDISIWWTVLFWWWEKQKPSIWTPARNCISVFEPRQFKEGICCGGHHGVTYGAELLYLRIFFF